MHLCSLELEKTYNMSESKSWFSVFETLVSYPPRVRLPARNGLVNKVKRLGLTPQNGRKAMRLRDC